jgi:hypothetical protein
VRSDATIALCTYNAVVEEFRLRKKENWENFVGKVKKKVIIII